MGNSNPDGCCGVATSCCPEKIPDRLTATIEVDCGQFTGQLVGSDSDTGNPVWSGSIDFECKDESGVCQQRTTNIKMTCYNEMAPVLRAEFCSVEEDNTSVNCDPFQATFSYGVPLPNCQCDYNLTAAAILTVTE